MKKSFLILFLVFTTILCSQIQWEQNGIPVRQGEYIGWFKCAVSIDENIIYLWSDARRGDRDIWAQKVDVNGSKLWPEDVLICGAIDEQEDVVAIKNENNEIIIAWPDVRILHDRSIFAQKIDENGNILWQEDGIPVCTTEDEQVNPKIVDDENGGAFFFWEDNRNVGGCNIYGIHILSNGEIVEGWEVNGNLITNGVNIQQQHSVCKDGNGGAIIAWKHVISYNNADIYAQRVSAGGELLWDVGGKIICDASNEQEKVKIISDENNDFVLVWKDRRNENSGDIYAQKIDLNGNLLWENEIEVYVGSGFQNNPQLVNSSNYSVIIVWEDGRNSSFYKDIYAQKIDINGNKLWDAEGISICNAENDQLWIDIMSDNTGGAWISWADSRGQGFPEVDIYLQHVNSDGESQLNENGNLVCGDNYTQSNPKLIKNNFAEIFLIWEDARTGSNELYMQTLNNEGNTNLPENGLKLREGISGDIYNHTMIANGDNPILLWRDSRNYRNDQIYMQILNDNGSGIFQEDGIPITLSSGYDQVHFDCIFNQEDDEIAVVWRENRTGYHNVYTQCIDLNGNYLWADTGLAVCEILSEQQYQQISRKDDAYYFGWSDFRANYHFGIFGQKIVNGELQWDAGGKEIVNNDDNETLEDLVENYYIWQNGLFPDWNICVKLVDENGDAAPGWSAEGLEICVANSNQEKAKGLLVPEGLLIIWDDYRSGNRDIYGQLVTADGNILWQEDGVPLVSQINNNYYHYSEMIYEEGVFYLVWQDNCSGISNDIYMQKFDMTGTALWEADLVIASGENDQETPEIVQVGDKFVIFYEETIEYQGAEYGDIKAQLVSDEGVLFWESTGLTICDARYCQTEPQAVSNGGNDVYVAWNDGRILVEAVDPYSLYAQKLYIDPVNIEDDEIVEQTGNMLSHYPNPFSSSTTISFDLSRKDAKNAKMDIYNIKGQKVRQFSIDDSRSSIVWNGKDENGKPANSGIYFYKLEVGKFESTKRMILMR
ncbi:MAG: T9SS type A sorting domain-containing protein [Candidatus Cloacimonetes bacterium]|nr:T9SS type A sorting domain-containing protein [Candidatus Cloacimonadota bacterium]